MTEDAMRVVADRPLGEDVSTVLADTANAGYEAEVLQLESGRSESDLDLEISQRAADLGINLKFPANCPGYGHKSSCESDMTFSSDRHARTVSTLSHQSVSTALTSPRTSLENRRLFSQPLISLQIPSKAEHRDFRKSVSFAEYEKLLAQANIPTVTNPRTSTQVPPSILSVSSKRSLFSIRNGIRSRLSARRQKPKLVRQEIETTCSSCGTDFPKPTMLHALPCSHMHCTECVRKLVHQAPLHETKMPPKCCGIAIHHSIIKNVLSPEEQLHFMESVQFCSSPVERALLGGFHNTKPISNQEGGLAETSLTCLADEYPYKQVADTSDYCRNRVLSQTQNKDSSSVRCTTCFCAKCFRAGEAISDLLGFPDEFDLENQRPDSSGHTMNAKSSDSQAQRRTAESKELQALHQTHLLERDRFMSYVARQWSRTQFRFDQSKVDAIARHQTLRDEVYARHEAAIMVLEDRQVTAEMELRASQSAEARVVNGRLRHMEAYCHGLGNLRSEAGSISSESRSSAASVDSRRIITERDLRQLGIQYNIRDDMERLHQSHINVLREKQAKQMQKHLDRQEARLHQLDMLHAKELRGLLADHKKMEHEHLMLYDERKSRMIKRWKLKEYVLVKSLEAANNFPGDSYAPLPEVGWPELSRSPDV